MSSSHHQSHHAQIGDLGCFSFPRFSEHKHTLPPGYTWDQQKKNYSPPNFDLQNYEESEPIWKDFRTREDTGSNGPRRPSNRFSAVFCHRGLYDRSLDIPENSYMAIGNGLFNDLFLHELDVFLKDNISEGFLAHDRHTDRVAVPNGRFDDFDIEKIVSEVRLTSKSLSSNEKGDILIGDRADKHGAQDYVLGLDSLLSRFSSGVVKRRYTFQLDMRNQDFAKAIALFSTRAENETKLFLKGYSTYYDDICMLTELVESYRISPVPIWATGTDRTEKRATEPIISYVIKKDTSAQPMYHYNFQSGKFPISQMGIASDNRKFRNPNWTQARKVNGTRLIMVFGAGKIIDLAVKAKAISDKDSKSPKELLKLLDYKFLYKIAFRHITSFTHSIIPGFSQIVPEINHSGLGLGYNLTKDLNPDLAEKLNLNFDARSPLDHRIIGSEKVIFESRVDRVLIDLAVNLRLVEPQMVFSSCTRLYELRLPSGKQYVGDTHTGQYVSKLPSKLPSTLPSTLLSKPPAGLPAELPDDEAEALSKQLRGIHGGLYPQSDIVNADDPYAEIAARTWIDDYARDKRGKPLDRSQLYDMSYKDWLAQAADTEVVRAVRRLDGPFLANTIG